MTMVDSIDQIDWQRADLRDPTKRQVLAESIAEIESGSVEHSLFHDLAWLLEAEGRGPDDVRVYICRAGVRPSGHAPFVVQPWLMRFRIGEVTLFSRSFERLHISGGPVTRSTDSGEVRADLVAKLFAQVRPLLTRRQVIYLEGVVKGSEVELAIAANSTRRMFRVIEPTPRYERRLIRFPSNFEEYLRSLKTQTRQNLRNTQRKLEKHLTGNLRLVRYDRRIRFPNLWVAQSPFRRRPTSGISLGWGCARQTNWSRRLSRWHAMAGPVAICWNAMVPPRRS
jgi:hypothetical protein